MSDYAARKRQQDRRLAVLLAPSTAQEHRVTAWLAGWDVDTLETLADMIERGQLVAAGIAAATAATAAQEDQ